MGLFKKRETRTKIVTVRGNKRKWTQQRPKKRKLRKHPNLPWKIIKNEKYTGKK